MQVPREVIEELIKYCHDENAAMFELGGEDWIVIVVGDKAFSPDQAAIIVAHALLKDVITGELSASNIIAKKMFGTRH